MTSSSKQRYNMDEILEYVMDSDNEMEETLKSDFGSEDDYELGSINVNVNKPQQPGKKDLTCDHSTANGKSEMNIPAATDTESPGKVSRVLLDITLPFFELFKST